jgi:hypothetical protein
MLRGGIVVVALFATSACATLESLRQFVQPPRFAEARDQPAEIRLQPPSGARPLGGAFIRLWVRVSNPNPFGFTCGHSMAHCCSKVLAPPRRRFRSGCPSNQAMNQ